jgi:hypothetical protein
MRTLLYTRSAVALAFSLAPSVVAASEAWAVGQITLTPAQQAVDGSKPSLLRVDLTDTYDGTTVELSAAAPLSRVRSAFTFRDKLAVLGEAGKAGSVLIFDIATKREIDRLLCYQPRRISDKWITYVEWYPSHSSGSPSDVILGYDLALSPVENRLERIPGPMPEEELPWGSPRVGFPLYPFSNVQQKSYINNVSDPLQAERILGSPSILLPSDKLVVPVDEGFDAGSYRTHLAVIDLSQGLANPVIREIALPTDKYPRRHDSPNMMEVNKLEAVSVGAVRLYLPEGEYGIGSIVVDINQ